MPPDSSTPAATFADLNLHERLLKAVDALAFEAPTPVQVAAIPVALAGRDLFAIAKTGSGKTAAFVLPLLARLLADEGKPMAPRALILSPTRELARQILDDVTALARFTFLKAEIVTGGEDFKVQAARLRRNPDIIVATPGRALEQLGTGNLDLHRAATLVIDEADRMLDMGFSDDVITLARACPASRQTLLYSATPGDARLQQLLGEVLRDPARLVLDDHRADSSTILQQVIPSDDNPHKEAQLKWLLAQGNAAKAMVFTNTRDMADRLQGVLISSGLRVFVLHGDKDQKRRKEAIARFRESKAAVLVTTDVAARGLDIEALDLVINFDMPRSGDNYLHRVGRTGRAGAPGHAISLVAAHEWNLMVSIERYLRRQFERRLLKEVPGNFKGPKKVKASGKPVGKKKKDSGRKDAAKKPAARGARPKTPKAPGASADGMAPLKRPRRPGQ
ncbi:MAG: DEAD/DEAH box helicase [Porticoccaceae bacterium]